MQHAFLLQKDGRCSESGTVLGTGLLGNRKMIINNYFISSDLELSSARDHDDETKIVFIIFNHFTCTEQVISEDLAKFLCNTEDTTINPTNWDDFVHATGEFTEIN